MVSEPNQSPGYFLFASLFQFCLLQCEEMQTNQTVRRMLHAWTCTVHRQIMSAVWAQKAADGPCIPVRRLLESVSQWKFEAVLRLRIGLAGRLYIYIYMPQEQMWKSEYKKLYTHVNSVGTRFFSSLSPRPPLPAGPPAPYPRPSPTAALTTLTVIAGAHLSARLIK